MLRHFATSTNRIAAFSFVALGIPMIVGPIAAATRASAGHGHRSADLCAFATSDMTRPRLTVTGAAPADSYASMATTGVVPLLAVIGDDGSQGRGGATVTLTGNGSKIKTVVTDSRVASGYIETPPQLDMGFHTGKVRHYATASLPENGYEFLNPADQEYLVGTAVITYYSVDGFELEKNPITVVFGYNPKPTKRPDIEGVIIR